MEYRSIAGNALAIFITLVQPAMAAQPTKLIDEGQRLASGLCAKCHMNTGQREKQGPMGIPAFKAVANRPEQTIEDVVEWLRSIPPMMPNHKLTASEMDALAAFIMSLRTNN